MKKITEKCCGCGTCAIVCPQKAIDIRLNDKGFFEPFIDNKKCINCGLCEKICAKNNKNSIKSINNKNIYVSVKKNQNDCIESSSGGIAYTIANHYANKGVSICGVTYDKKNDIAKHIVINTKEDIKKISGSKYLQSYSSCGFEEILKKEKGVIFGTPCQINSLDILLKRKNKREKFILIDIFCHGVPSYYLWHSYLKSIRKEENTASISFRKKKHFIISINDKDYPYETSSFSHFYLKGLLNNEACYDCPFRRHSNSDIRLGDFTNKNYQDSNISPSVIIINTSLGKKVFDSIKNEIYYKEVDYNDVDSTQEKEIRKDLPKKYNTNIKKLKNGIKPDKLIIIPMIKKRIKYIIKRVLLKIKNNTQTEDVIKRIRGE